MLAAAAAARFSSTTLVRAAAFVGVFSSTTLVRAAAFVGVVSADWTNGGENEHAERT
jgi:hypothetical protein